MGPLIAAVAFLLFAVPDVGAHYWTAFFPAFVVLGLGMAISIAPLTTVVMNSVDQERAGTASGINNTVARVAGVLAVAVLGALMAAGFAHSLRRSLVSLNLNVSIVRQLESNVAKLGSLDAPPGVDSQSAAAIRSAIAGAFIFGFRLIVPYARPSLRALVSHGGRYPPSAQELQSSTAHWLRTDHDSRPEYGRNGNQTITGKGGAKQAG